MGKFLFWVHIASWVGNIIIGARSQRKHGSTPPTPIRAGMYIGGHDPTIAAFTVGAIPVVSTLFIFYFFYL